MRKEDFAGALISFNPDQKKRLSEMTHFEEWDLQATPDRFQSLGLLHYGLCYREERDGTTVAILSNEYASFWNSNDPLCHEFSTITGKVLADLSIGTSQDNRETLVDLPRTTIGIPGLQQEADLYDSTGESLGKFEFRESEVGRDIWDALDQFGDDVSTNQEALDRVNALYLQLNVPYQAVFVTPRRHGTELMNFYELSKSLTDQGVTEIPQYIGDAHIVLSIGRNKDLGSETVLLRADAIVCGESDQKIRIHPLFKDRLKMAKEQTPEILPKKKKNIVETPHSFAQQSELERLIPYVARRIAVIDSNPQLLAKIFAYKFEDGDKIFKYDMSYLFQPFPYVLGHSLDPTTEGVLEQVGFNLKAELPEAELSFLVEQLSSPTVQALFQPEVPKSRPVGITVLRANGSEERHPKGTHIELQPGDEVFVDRGS